MAAELTAGAVSLAEIQAAAERVRPYVLRTPLIAAPSLLDGALFLKAENLQRTGSFKVRGAFNAVRQLTAAQRAQGVITLSAGNHGQALAYAAQSAGTPCVVVIREDAPSTKVEAVRSFGAEVVLAPVAQWQQRLEWEQQQRGLYLVHPFDDAGVIAGQGTVALEILDDAPEVATVVVPVGGGGLIAGVASAIKALKPDVRVIGVEPVGACVVTRSLKAGRPLDLERLDTIAEGLAAPYTRPLNLGIIQRCVDEVVTVSDEQLVDALRLLILKSKLVVEPAGAAGVAVALARPPEDRPTVAILTGGNVDPQRLAGWLARPA